MLFLFTALDFFIFAAHYSPTGLVLLKAKTDRGQSFEPISTEIFYLTRKIKTRWQHPHSRTTHVVI